MVALVSDEDFEPFVGGPPPDPSERTWRHPSEIAAQANADAAAAALPSRRPWGTPSWNATTAGVLIVGSLTAAACLAAVAVFQVAVGSNSNDLPSLAGPTDRIEAAGLNETFDLESAAAMSGLAPPASSSTVPASVDPAPVVSPAVSSFAEEQLVDIAVGTELVASAIMVNGYLIMSATAVGNQLSVSYSRQGQWALAYLVGVDPYSDLAVFRASTESRAGQALQALSSNLDGAEAVWEPTSSPAAGDEVTSVSITENGLETSTGFVLATDRTGTTNEGQPLIGLIDTNLRLPEHRGTVLIDATGNVVGVVIDTSSSLASAIPIGDAVAIADRLTQQGWANETWIGFVGFDQEDGVEVIDVTAGGPAATADLRPGDVIRYLDGARIDHMGGITAGLRRAAPGDTITVVVERGGELVALRIEVSAYETEPGQTSESQDGARGAVSEPIDG